MFVLICDAAQKLIYLCINMAVAKVELFSIFETYEIRHDLEKKPFMFNKHLTFYK
jgi:hypothetical protein